MISPFGFSKIPRLVFGVDTLAQVGALAKPYGTRAVIITGNRSGERSGALAVVETNLKEYGISWDRLVVTGEPTPKIIDDMVSSLRGTGNSVVIAMGGGSVVDAGKAVAAMSTVDGTVAEYLEDIGSRDHPGTTIPLIAIPTTAGTGSEATKNAVLSEVGEQGFKKSLRHESFVPVIALVDPRLSAACPPDITAACGMDAFTQLLEAAVSTKSNPMTEALSHSGIEKMARSLLPVCTTESDNLEKRSDIAYCAFLSGIALANAGLGTVHGFASSIGGYFAVPHGVVCGTLLASCVKHSIELLRKQNDPGALAAISRFASAARCCVPEISLNDFDACSFLIDMLYGWIDKLPIPRLADYGIKESDFNRIIKATDNKNNPAKLGSAALRSILLERL